MVFTKIPLDLKKRTTLAAFRDYALFHSAAEGCFKEGRQRPLWRIDHNGAECFMLILSRDVPDTSEFSQRYGYGRAKTLSYDSFLSQVTREGQRLRFRAAVNPVVCIKGRRVPLNIHKTERQPYSAQDWLRDRLKKHGSRLLEAECVDRRNIHMKHGRGTLFSATYEGFLQVVDSELFGEMLVSGMGHGKAYGLGLVTVAPC